MKRDVIFDWGGVFMKTVDQTPRYVWDDRLRLPHGTVERVVHGSDSWRVAQTGQLPLADYWADVARQLNLSDEQTAALAVDFYSGDHLDTELVEYARSLRLRGHAVALLSNDSPALAVRLASLGVADLFDPLIISAHIGVMKPAAGAYEAVLEKLHRPAEATIFVDDMAANIEGARSLGMLALRYISTAELKLAIEPLLES